MLKIQELPKIIKHVDKTIQDERLDICRSCKWYVKATASCGPLIIGRTLTAEEKKELEVTSKKSKIRLCGCRMKEKVKYAIAECPAGKWKATMKLGEVKVAMKEREEILTFAKGLKERQHVERKELELLFEYGSLVMGSRQKITTCPSCVRDMINYLIKEMSNLEGENV